MEASVGCSSEIRVRPEWELIGENIYVQSNVPDMPDFLHLVKRNLHLIVSEEVGCRLVTKIQSGSVPLFIRKGDKDKAFKRVVGESFGVGINLSFSEKKVCVIGEEEPVVCPFFIVLAHELIHAYHFFYGKHAPERPCDKKRWTNSEEEYTIKGYDVADDRIRPKITENAIRREHGLPERISHHSSVLRISPDSVGSEAAAHS